MFQGWVSTAIPAGELADIELPSLDIALAEDPEHVRKAWREYVKRWRVQLELRISGRDDPRGPGFDEWHLVCAGYWPGGTDSCWWTCGSTIMVIHDGAVPRAFCPDDFQDVLLRHVIDQHPRCWPVVGRIYLKQIAKAAS